MRKKRKKKNKLVILLISLILVFILSFSFIRYYSKKAIPLITAYAEAEVNKLLVLIINKSVSKQINNVDISDVFEVTYNNNGEVILVDFNSKRTNIALSTISNLIEVNLKALEEGKIDMLELPDNSLDSYDTDLLDKGIILEVPLGVNSGSVMTANIGPKIPVRISLVGNISSGFSTDVVEYGINNALIKLYIDVEVSAKVIMPFISDDITVSSSIPIAMKVIQGKVPDYYAGSFTTKSNIVASN